MDPQILPGKTNAERLTYRCEFERIADEYRFIDNDEVSIFVPWDDEGKALLDELTSAEPSTDVYVRLQRYTVSVPFWMIRDYEEVGALQLVGNIRVLEIMPGSRRLYSDSLGLLAAGEGELDTLIVC